MRFVGFALWLLAAPLCAQQLEIRFLDVGQGDAALIRQAGKTILIDAGSSASIAPYLHAFHVDTIDLLIASHNHSDHIGGMLTVFASSAVRAYLDNGVSHTTATYQQTIRAARASGAQYLQATDRTITLGAVAIRVLAPPPAQDQNNSSVGILIQFGEFRGLWTGDSEQEELSYWLDGGALPRVNVLKVAHHGSANGTSPTWIAATRPQVAVISVGQGNSYGHPSAGVISQWDQAGARVYRTDRDGSVLVIANDDGSFVVSTSQAEPTGVVQFQPFTSDSSAGAVAPPVRVMLPACCRTCTTGKACGNSCISRDKQCHQPRGCACDAKP